MERITIEYNSLKEALLINEKKFKQVTFDYERL